MPRDASGNYTLPLGNPVVDGTVIESVWANNTMSDIAVQLNNVLTRDGLLGMIDSFYIVDGGATAPGLAFVGAQGTGLWRDNIHVGLSWNGVEVFGYNGDGITLQPGKELYIPQPPAANNSAVNKSYVATALEDYLPLAGGTMTGDIDFATAVGLYFFGQDGVTRAWKVAGGAYAAGGFGVYNLELLEWALLFDRDNNDAAFAAGIDVGGVLTRAGNVVWDAGNFNPATKATLGANVAFSIVRATQFVATATP